MLHTPHGAVFCVLYTHTRIRAPYTFFLRFKLAWCVVACAASIAAATAAYTTPSHTRAHSYTQHTHQSAMPHIHAYRTLEPNNIIQNTHTHIQLDAMRCEMANVYCAARSLYLCVSRIHTYNV